GFFVLACIVAIAAGPMPAPASVAGSHSHAVAGHRVPDARSTPIAVFNAASQKRDAVQPLIARTKAFPLISRDQQIASYGLSQAVAPPDTMVAAGPTLLFELVNRTASVWSKTGARVALANLDTALPLPAGYTVADPRVLYDAASGRFFMSMNWGNSSNDSITFVAVSKTSDPRGGFNGYALSPTTNGTLHDQPKIGVTDDKVVIEWDDFAPGSVYTGTEIWVLQKSAMLAGGSVPMSSFGPALGYLSAVPAQSLTSTTTAYAVHESGSTAVVVQITGTPALNNVVFTTSIIGIPAVASPPPAAQPGGPALNTGDIRFFSAVWRAGQLWLAANAACTQGSVQHACMRIVDIATGSTPTLANSFNVSPTGYDAFYPAVVTDPVGRLWVAFTASNASTYASAVAAEITFSGTTPTVSYSLFMAGVKTYNDTLWGDFSSISIDPSTGSIWAAAEYAPSGSAANWGTAAGSFSP